MRHNDIIYKEIPSSQMCMYRTMSLTQEETLSSTQQKCVSFFHPFSFIKIEFNPKLMSFRFAKLSHSHRKKERRKMKTRGKNKKNCLCV